MTSRRRRRILALFVLLSAALLALLALGHFPQEPLRRLAEGRLREMLGPGARIGRLSVEPFRLRAVVEGLVAEGPSFRLEVDHLDARLAPATLQGRGLHLRRLDGAGVRLVLRPDPAGSSPSTPPPPLSVDVLSLRDATVRYHDPALGGDVVLEGVSLLGSLGHGAVDLATTGGRWERTPAVALAPVRARARLSPLLSLELESFEGGFTRSRLRASGPVGSLLVPRPDLRFDATLDLAELAAPLALGDLSGLVQLEGTVQGPQPRLAATATGERLRLQAVPVDAATVQLESAGRTVTGQLTASLLGGRAQANLRRDDGRVEARLRATGLTVARIRQAGLWDPGALEGALDLQAEARGTEKSVHLEATAEAAGRLGDGTTFTARLEARGPFSSDLRSDLAWNATLVAQGQDGTMRRAKADLRGSARGPWPPRVEGEVAGDVELLAGGQPLHLAPQGSFHAAGAAYGAEATVAGLGSGLTVALAGRGAVLDRLTLSGDALPLEAALPGARGQAALAARLSGPIDALDGTATLQIADAAWKEAALGPLTAEATLRRGRATVHLAAPDLKAEADFETTTGPRGQLSGTVILQATPFDRFGPLLPPSASGLAGDLSARVAVSLPLSGPADVTVRAEVSALRAKRGDLEAKSLAPFVLGYARDEVTVEGLRLAGPGLELQADGRLGARANGALDLRLRAQAALGDVPAPKDFELGGRAEVDVALAGRVSRPDVRGHVALRELRVKAPSIPLVSVADGRLELDGDALVLPPLAAELAGGRVTLAGRVPVAAVWAKARRTPGAVSADEGAQLSVQWSEIDAATVLAALGRDGDQVEAQLAGRAEVSGGLAALAEPSATVWLPATPARLQDLSLQWAETTLELRAGRVSTEGFRLETEGGNLVVAGSADLVGRRLDANGRGQLDLRVLSPLLGDVALSGAAVVDLTAQGSFDAPRTEGAVQISDATVRLRLLPQAITDLTALVVFDGERIQTQDAHASFGSGTLTMKGGARLGKDGLRDVRLDLTGRDMALRYPVGMRSRLNADLVLSDRSGGLRLEGTVTALRGAYDLDAALSESVAVSKSTGSPVLRSIGLDLVVVTDRRVSVRGQLAEFFVTGRLNVRGDLETPAPVGSLDIEEGGSVFLQGQEFAVEAGSRLIYAGNWDPQLALKAFREIDDNASQDRSRRGPVKVTVSLVGSLSKPTVQLEGDPPRSPSELLSLVAVGDSTDRAAGMAVGAETANFLLGGKVSQSLRRLGFDQVSIQPELVSREGDVKAGARFTFGKRLTPWLRLIFSESLQSTEDRFLKLEAEPRRDIILSGQRSDDGTFAYGAGQTFRWGGPPRQGPSGQRGGTRLREVRVQVEAGLDEAELRKLLRVKAGDRRTFWRLQDDADRLRAALVEQGYLEAVVDARLDEAVATFRVRGRSRYAWLVEGMTAPPDLGPEIRKALFEEEALDLGRERLLAELRQSSHLRARVTTSVRATPEARTLVFQVQPGPTLMTSLRFPGASAFSEGRLREISGGPGRVLTEPEAAAEAIVAAYREAHYLAATAGPRQVHEGEEVVQIEMPVHEGPRAKVVAIRFEGASRPEAELLAASGLRTGVYFDEAATQRAVDALRAHYFGLGFPSVRASAELQPSGTDFVQVLQLAEGPQVTVGSVVIQGATRTRLGLIRRQVQIRPGDPLDPRRLSELERHVSDLGVFSRVAVSSSEGSPATVTVSVQEGDRVRAGYEVRYEDGPDPNDAELRGQFDATLRNVFGIGLNVGARVVLSQDFRAVRPVAALPLWFGRGSVSISAWQEDEDLPPEEGSDAPPNVRKERGLQAQATSELTSRWKLLYGYRYERSSFFAPAIPFESVTTTSAVDASVVTDSRDNVLDAHRGRFLTLALEYAPPRLGGDLTFVKGLSQFYLNLPVGDSLTWAQGYRLGLAHGFQGQQVTFDDRFKAGGPNSVRGFETDSLGPTDAAGRNSGQATIIVNQELRYRYRWGLGGVAFWDAGQVFDKASHLSLDLRHALGLGLRWESPVGLLRVDFGFPLQRREDEEKYQIFFSVGQAF